jgi:polysaccharide export outer membrane protein
MEGGLQVFTMMPHPRLVAALCALALAAPALARGQATKPPAAGQKTAATSAAATPAPAAAAPGAANAPPGYVIGPDDVLTVLFRYDKDMTTEATVRPDGMISLPVLHDIPAAGLTPEQLRDRVTERAKQFIEDPAVTVIVKAINSRKAFITGQVARPGSYPLTTPTTVLQLIAMAGGLTEYADEKDITIMRVENGRPVTYVFNYKDVSRRKNLRQNIELKPGDTVIVP